MHPAVRDNSGQAWAHVSGSYWIRENKGEFAARIIFAFLLPERDSELLLYSFFLSISQAETGCFS